MTPPLANEVSLIEQKEFINHFTSSPNQKYIATVSDNNIIKIWNGETGELERTLERSSHISDITSKM
ncbi:MAG: hypothetical protein AB8B67_04160 [Rickettsiaceae bacterium]